MIRSSLVTLSLLALTACQPSVTTLNPIETSPSFQAQDVQQLSAGFLQALKKENIKLDKDELNTVTLQRFVEPNGQFASRPAMGLDAESNLQVHFLKHRNEFRPKIQSTEEYLAKALKAARGENGPMKFYFDPDSFAKGYQSNVIRWNPVTKELVAIRPDGALTTYYTNNKLNTGRFIPMY